MRIPLALGLVLTTALPARADYPFTYFTRNGEHGPEGPWVEGPTAIQLGNSFIVYDDAYQQRHYGALRSRDLRTWEDVTDRLVMPEEGTPVRMRHGNVIEAPRPLIDRLLGAPGR